PRRSSGRLPHPLRARLPRRLRAAARAAPPRETRGAEVSAALDIAAASRSELGQRKTNEDKVRVCREGPRWIAILADGAGGHRGGAEASRRAVDELEAALHDPRADFSPASLTRAVVSAHAEVQRAQRAGQEGLGRMHSTVVVLWLDM